MVLKLDYTMRLRHGFDFTLRHVGDVCELWVRTNIFPYTYPVLKSETAVLPTSCSRCPCRDQVFNFLKAMDFRHGMEVER